MKQIESLSNIQAEIDSFRLLGKTIGFIPTMGALHEGHLSLVKQSIIDNDITVVSIFVNPAQFAPNEDFDQYPRTIEQDVYLLDQLKYVDYVFTPRRDCFYPQDTTSMTQIHIPLLSTYYCGDSRPHFFDAVCSIVLRLFNCLFPTAAYFGEKDFQQLFLIQKMVFDLCLPIKILGCPIIRQANGLAMSSRNVYLSETQQDQASYLYKMLTHAQSLYQAGNISVTDITAQMRLFLESNSSIQIEYIAFVDETTLITVPVCTDTTRILVAGYIGKTRLIDNLALSRNA